MGSRVRHVVEHLLLIEAEPLGNRNEALRSESSVAIDVHGHAFTATLADGQLARDAQRVADLRLARSELAEDLRDRAGFDTSTEQLVEGLRSAAQTDHALALLEERRRRLEAQVDNLLTCVNNLVYFCLRKTLNDDKMLLGRECYSFDCMEAGFLKFLDITGIDALFFERLDRSGTVDLHLFLLLFFLSSLLLFGFLGGLHFVSSDSVLVKVFLLI
jgi:hypothetical protein